MTKSSNQEHHLNSPARRRFWLLVLSRGGITLGGLLLIGIMAGIWRLWTFVQKDLTPLAQTNLTTTLNRPVNLGKVTGISLKGVEFGPSAIPATPQDPDSVAVDGVEVSFDFLQLIFKRELKLDVTLVNPNVYVEQDEKGRWISLSIKSTGKGGPIKTDLDKLRFRNGKLALLPHPKAGGDEGAGGAGEAGELGSWGAGELGSWGAGGDEEATSPSSSSSPSSPSSPTQNSALSTQHGLNAPLPLTALSTQNSPVLLSQVTGTAQILDKGQRIKFDVEGKPDDGGGISVQGETLSKVLAGTFHFRGQDLQASNVTRLVKLPLTLEAGRVNGDLQIQQAPQQKPLLYGSAELQGVTIQIPKAPQQLLNTQGNLRFQGTEIQSNNVTTNYGKIPLVAGGIIDTVAGFKVAGRVNAVSLANAQETLNIKLPVPTSGEVKADLQILGPPTDPVISGTVRTIDVARVDKVDFESISGEFEFPTTDAFVTLKDIRGKAKVGGEITGAGRIDVGKNPQVNLNFAAKNVPGNAIAQAYDTTPGFIIGNVSGTAQMFGPPTNVKTVVKWQAPQATYPGTGEVIVHSNRTYSFRNVVLNVGGGIVRAYGNFDDQRWQAFTQSSGVQVERFVDKSQLQNVSLAGAEFKGGLILSGNRTPFEILTIRPQGAKVQIGGGTVTISQLQLQNQGFSAQLIANNVRLGRILQNSPPALSGALAGKFQIAGDRENFSLKTLRGTGTGKLNVAGGSVTATNIQLANGLYQAQLSANNLAVQELATTPKQFQGRLTGKFNVAGSVESFTPQTIQATGQAQVNVGGGIITASNIQLANGLYQAQVKANKVPVQRLAAVPPQFQGAVNGELNVAGSVESFTPQTIQATGQAQVNVGNGTITAANIQLANGRYQAQVTANKVPLQRLATVPPQLRGTVNGELNVAGSVESFTPQTIQATGQAQVNVGGGTITAANIQLANGRYQAQVTANKVPLQRLATVPPQFQGAVNGELNVAGSVESFTPQSIQATGQGRVNLAGGTITASNIQLANGRYQVAVDAAGVQLNRLNQQLRGEFGGKLQLAGRLGSSALADLRAAGQVQLSQGLAGIERPLTASLAWNGEKLRIDQATAPGLSVSGDILANARTAGIPEITQLNLNIQAQDYDLKQLPLNLPQQIALAGRIDFNGQVTGRLPLPNVKGQIATRDLVVQGFAFEPLLRGNIVSAQGQGLNLDLVGNSDRIDFNLDANNRPKSFLIKWQQAVAIGNTQGDNLALNLANFPLEVLNLTPPANLRLGNGKVAGLLTGDLQVNQQTLAANGNLAIASPKIGRIQGDRLAAVFNYANGKATLTSSEFVKGESIYAFAGSFGQSFQGPQLQGKLNVKQGQIQDVLTVAQIFDLQDLQGGAESNYGTAADLTTNPAGLPGQPLLNQIKRFYEIDTELAEQQQQRIDANPVPDLADLKGTFNGEVTVDTATANGLSVDFSLNGQNFVWGREDEPTRYYTANQIIAEGSFAKGVLKLRPFRIESENSLLAFSGNIGGNEQSGQLRVNNFPIQLINNFAKLPIDITGNLNGSAALAGSLANPQARGELAITDGTLNAKPVETATASFSYNDGRLNFGSTVSVAGPEPVNITGSIPYQLPFATVTPDNNQITLDVKVRNEGLALLNLLTNQVAFEKGEGEIDLKVRGTRQQPELNGVATVNDATFSAQALPEKVRRVTGKVNFNFDRISVENLQGRFSRGQVEAAGDIAISNKEQVTINNPLTVKADQLTMNLKGLYQGGASGNLQITGSALNPFIGGKVNLFNGKVLLAESNDSNQSGDNNINLSLTKDNKQSKTETGNANTRFNNLEIELGKNVEVTRPPILNFQATGNLIVNGTFAEPIPDGTIRLKQGGVNLFTTQFKLVGNYENTATFKSDQPRDPILDVKLFAKVLDVVQSSDFTRANTVGLAAIDSVRVEASVQGPASKLNENLELTSSPSRSQTEIVSLLGGGFVDTEGRGDSTLGLINIAGSAVFNNFQSAFNQIGTAFGLSELRIFPTIISDNPEAGRSNSTLELAAEAGIDISSKISVSSIKILTASDPFQWGINYRINDEFRVRASTNLEDDSRAVVEFQRRF